MADELPHYISSIITSPTWRHIHDPNPIDKLAEKVGVAAAGCVWSTAATRRVCVVNSATLAGPRESSRATAIYAIFPRMGGVFKYTKPGLKFLRVVSAEIAE